MFSQRPGGSGGPPPQTWQRQQQQFSRRGAAGGGGTRPKQRSIAQRAARGMLASAMLLAAAALSAECYARLLLDKAAAEGAGSAAQGGGGRPPAYPAMGPADRRAAHMALAAAQNAALETESFASHDGLLWRLKPGSRLGVLPVSRSGLLRLPTNLAPAAPNLYPLYNARTQRAANGAAPAPGEVTMSPELDGPLTAVPYNSNSRAPSGTSAPGYGAERGGSGRDFTLLVLATDETIGQGPAPWPLLIEQWRRRARQAQFEALTRAANGSSEPGAGAAPPAPAEEGALVSVRLAAVPGYSTEQFRRWLPDLLQFSSDAIMILPGRADTAPMLALVPDDRQPLALSDDGPSSASQPAVSAIVLGKDAALGVKPTNRVQALTPGALRRTAAWRLWVEGDGLEGGGAPGSEPPPGGGGAAGASGRRVSMPRFRNNLRDLIGRASAGGAAVLLGTMPVPAGSSMGDSIAPYNKAIRRVHAEQDRSTLKPIAAASEAGEDALEAGQEGAAAVASARDCLLLDLEEAVAQQAPECVLADGSLTPAGCHLAARLLLRRLVESALISADAEARLLAYSTPDSRVPDQLAVEWKIGPAALALPRSRAGEGVTLTAQLKNRGNTTWLGVLYPGTGLGLTALAPPAGTGDQRTSSGVVSVAAGWIDGPRAGELMEVALPVASVEPGGETSVTLHVPTPEAPGTWQCQWSLALDGTPLTTSTATRGTFALTVRE